MDSGEAVQHRFGCPSDAIDDDGASGRHRLDRDDAEVLDGWEHERECVLEQRPHEFVGHAPEHVHRHLGVCGE
ncbi:hypothetical protein ASG80_03645 [Agromyces sp. Soil535]|nr:hypothetical protein ASG80_03645 [Agromyces sp. Soil535]